MNGRAHTMSRFVEITIRSSNGEFDGTASATVVVPGLKVGSLFTEVKSVEALVCNLIHDADGKYLKEVLKVKVKKG